MNWSMYRKRHRILHFQDVLQHKWGVRGNLIKKIFEISYQQRTSHKALQT